MRFTPGLLARELRLGAPTRQQAAVIAAPADRPLLVVAGAGSGKTETMASRVVWLVANDHVRPDQILGLTFTRKAAGELGTRLRHRLGRLARQFGRPELLAGEPTVATYHSYAARIVREHGVRAGYEPMARMLSEAVAWQIADSATRAYDGDMSAVTAAPSSVTEAVLHLAAELSEHLRTPDELAAWTGRFFAEVQGKGGAMPRAVRDLLARQRARLQLLPLVRAYTEGKERLEACDFGDHLARAAHVASDHPEVGQVERDRYRVVLLDEYQDTSVAQTTLLRSLFGQGHPVTAVGDPCQSIYGWRGASAGTLERFPSDFPDHDGTPSQVADLTTSWRNRPEILDVANAVSRPLRVGGHRVKELLAGPRDVVHPSAHGTAVRCALLETSADEADWIARRIHDAWIVHARVPSTTPAGHIAIDARPRSAVLVRTRSQIPAIVEALRDRGVPCQVIGLGGLLDVPEVRDLVSVLRVLADPTAGADCLRILTSPRWRVGPRDIVALHTRARDLAADRGREAITEEPLLANRLDEAVLVEALDDLGEAERYSEPGYQRLVALGAELRQLRSRLGQTLPDLVADVERTIGLDVEVAMATGDSAVARGNLDAFGGVVTRFACESDQANLRGLLAYLSAAETSERGLATGEVEVVGTAVQVLTVHAAKGLEWDVVAVAGLVEGTFPNAGSSGDHWLQGLGVLPFPLRGDSTGLPVLDLVDAETGKDVAAAIEDFTEAWREHGVREERRLAYVAVTRPREVLLASGYWWSAGGRRKRTPSRFLCEIRDRCLAGAGTVDTWTPDPGPEAENPLSARVSRASWPIDPLGDRRPAVERAAELVLAAGERPMADAERPDQADPVVERWRDQAALLLAERRAGTCQPGVPVDVALPAQLSVSSLVFLGRDPDGLARALRRPLPQRPAPAATLGTAFHAWLEHRLLADRLFDLDELPGAEDGDSEVDQQVLAELRQCFESSSWADRVPVDVEVPFTMSLGTVVVRGRIDAVYSSGNGGYEVVDWKTGAVPHGAVARSAAIQLAAYRLAWAARAGVPVERVEAVFYYVRHGVALRPRQLLDERGLVDLIAGLPPSDPAFTELLHRGR